MPRPCAVRTSAWARQKMDFPFSFSETAAERERKSFPHWQKKNRPSESEGMNVCAANIHKMCMEEFYCYCAVCIQPKIVYPLETFWAEWNYSSGFGVLFFFIADAKLAVNNQQIWYLNSIAFILFISWGSPANYAESEINSSLARARVMADDVRCAIFAMQKHWQKNFVDRLEDECQLSDVSSGFSNECQSKTKKKFGLPKIMQNFLHLKFNWGGWERRVMVWETTKSSPMPFNVKFCSFFSLHNNIHWRKISCTIESKNLEVKFS